MRSPEATEQQSDGAANRKIPTLFEATWLNRYHLESDSLTRLYEKSKNEQWNGSTLLDWSREVDPESDILPSHALLLGGFAPYERLSQREKIKLRHEVLAYQLSQFLHGEQGALAVASQLVTAVPTLDAKLYASSQCMDEARHIEVFSRYLREKMPRQYPIHQTLRELLDVLVTDSRWDFKYLGMQIVVEGLAIAAFNNLCQLAQEPLLVQLLRSVIADEARHVAFGVLSVRDHFRGLPENERREREDLVVFSCERLHRRLVGADIAAVMEWNEAEVTERVRSSPLGQAFISSLFSRIVPNLKKLGMLTPKVRERFQDLNILQFEDADPDVIDNAATRAAAGVLPA
jgi:hypothetical protein